MMKKASKILITAIIMLLSLGALVMTASAESIDLQKSASLKIVYRHNNENCEGLDIEIYRVASVKDGYTFLLEAPFNNYSVNINDVQSQEEWRSIAITLSSYAIADNITPTAKQTTDTNGIAEFKNLRPGMYLTLGVRKVADGKIVIFEDFLTVIPGRSDTDGSYMYDLTVYPKSRTFTPKDGTVPYKVIKQWKDNGKNENRTKSVEIDIFKNGALSKTVTLSAENNWMYSWRADNDGSDWRVVERNVPDGYYVNIFAEDTTLIVTNTFDKTSEDNPDIPPDTPPDNHPDDDPDVPQTGDTNSIELYIIIACVSGILIIILSLYKKRKDL